MPAISYWVAVCVPTGTGNPQAYVGPTSALRCTTPTGVPGSTHLVEAYLSDKQTNWEELSNLSVNDAHVLGAAVGAVWAVAWGFKAIRFALMDRHTNIDD